MKDYNDSKKVEEAITFLVNQIGKSGNNPKPVILHSIRVGFYLWDKNYPLEVILGGILHDLIEDTDTEVKDIEQSFGSKVAKLVEANSFDTNISDKVDRYKNTFASCISYGKEALVVKAADILDNAPYYVLGDNLSFGKRKIAYFLEVAKPLIGQEQVYEDLELALSKLSDKH